MNDIGRRPGARRFFRLVAAVWFAVPGGLLALLAASFFRFYPEATPYTIARSVLIVVLISGAAGALFGAWILDSELVQSGLIAALVGVFVAGVSWEASLFALLGVSYLGMDYPHLGGFIYSFFMMSVGVTLMFGWLFVLVGGLCGSLLFRQRRQITGRHFPA